MVRLARLLFVVLAVAGYAANGAQAHIAVDHGETLNMMMCSTHGTKTMTVSLPGDPPKATPETCCGDCTAPVALPADPPTRLMAPARYGTVFAPAHAPNVHPGSPLWPGAPPQGPPTTR